jgi:lipopolysaccharide biosynthesis regulator YciM
MKFKHDDYPNLWKRGLIQANVRKRANHRCEQCGMEFHTGTNLAIFDRNRRGNPTIGTVHHIDMDKQNCSMANLVYLCQRCHLSVHFVKWKPGKPIPKRWQNNLPIWTVKRGLIPVLYDRPLL